MILIPLTPDKYHAVLTKLLNGVSGVTEFQVPGVSDGLIVTSQITLHFSYDGVGLLTVPDYQAHGLAKFASENTIKAHLTDLLTGV